MTVFYWIDYENEILNTVHISLKFMLAHYEEMKLNVFELSFEFCSEMLKFF